MLHMGYTRSYIALPHERVFVVSYHLNLQSLHDAQPFHVVSFWLQALNVSCCTLLLMIEVTYQLIKGIKVTAIRAGDNSDHATMKVLS